jgi:hypothetical protein
VLKRSRLVKISFLRKIATVGGFGLTHKSFSIWQGLAPALSGTHLSKATTSFGRPFFLVDYAPDFLQHERSTL